MKYIVIVLLLFSTYASADQLVPSKNYELSHILGTMRVVYENKDLPFVRIIKSKEEISECGGTFETCPNSRLFIIVSMGDLGDPPILYELPKSKGWKLDSTEMKENGLYITLDTTLNFPNISIESRKKWKSKKYRIRVSGYGGLYLEN